MDKGKARQAFDKYDLDGSKKITKSEFGKFCTDHYNITKEQRTPLMKKLINGMFEVADGNGAFNMNDGQLNFDEFYKIVSLIPEGAEDLPKTFAHVIFNLVDKDQSGTICYKELRKFLSNIKMSMTSSGAKSSLKQFDNDGDYVLSFDEFYQLLCAMEF